MAAAGTAFFTMAACTTAPASVLSPTASPTPTSAAATPSPTAPPVDPVLTKQICAAAAKATADGTKVFNDQLAALEQAAAKNDQAAMVAAAEAINKQFTDLASALGVLAQQPVSPAVKVVLSDVSTALTEMASLSYTGTTVDIRKKLLDFAAAFGKTCG